MPACGFNSAITTLWNGVLAVLLERWVKDFFITHTVDLTQFPKYRPDRYGFVNATLDDNPYITSEYREDLEDLYAFQYVVEARASERPAAPVAAARGAQA